MILVKYKEDNTIEGFVVYKEDFKKWLKEHNIRRTKENQIPEQENEFELVEIFELEAV